MWVGEPPAHNNSPTITDITAKMMGPMTFKQTNKVPDVDFA